MECSIPPAGSSFPRSGDQIPQRPRPKINHMPGIAGIISQRPARECQPLVDAMVSTMRRETFCKAGSHFVPAMGIHCGWVALAESFAEAGMLQNEESDVVLILSGEVFLDADTGRRLKQKGHQLGSGKADWLIHLYEEEGESFFKRLNGLFSGLLIDKSRGKAFLFNDRYGSQRIYVHDTGDELYFASEAKALLRVLPALREFNPDGIADFLTFGCTLEGRTLFRGIQHLPGGSLWTFEPGNCRREKYFSPETWEALPELPAAEYEARLQETFRRIVPRHFEAESNIGVALTGGLDTRMIMACRPPAGSRPATYTFSGTSGRTLDDKIASHIADASGLDHQLLRLGPDFFQDFATHADRTVFATDGCLGVSGAHELYFNRQARALAPLRLTGNYGSEILRGISTFKPVPLSPRLFDPGLAGVINETAPKLARRRRHPLTFAAFEEIPWNLFGNLAAGRSQLSFRTPYLDNELVALAYQVPAPLRKSPFPALRLINAENAVLGAIPTDRGFIGDQAGLGILFRRLFAEATCKLSYYSNEGLPRFASPLDRLFRNVTARLGISGLHKYLHYPNWFRNELAGHLQDVLARPQVRQNGHWNPHFIGRMADEHIAGRKNWGLEINAVLTMEAVERLLFRELPRGL